MTDPLREALNDLEREVSIIRARPKSERFDDHGPEMFANGVERALDALRAALSAVSVPTPLDACDIEIGPDDWPGAHWCRTHKRTGCAPQPVPEEPTDE